MTPAERRRHLAASCHTLASNHLDTCRNPVTVKRYASDHGRLSARIQTAEDVLEAAALLIRDAEILEARARGAA